ncbi:MAG TPA: ATP-binding protein [Terriglobales bacterium]|nr:ATP-binding protein [Terriglobales bacterium]
MLDANNAARSSGAGRLAGSAPRVVSSLPRHASVLLLLAVLSVELGVGGFAVRDVLTADDQANGMYTKSVLGLRRIGELQYDAQETRRSTLYALTTNDSNLQVEYADQSRAADRRVSQGITQYLAEAGTGEELALASRLQADWAAYLKVRYEVLASILEGSIKEAVSLDLSGGVSSFERVRQDLEEVKRLYDQQASQQLAAVVASSRRTVTRLIGVLVFTFLFVSVSVWAIQRSRMAGALQLAKLQMDFVASISHELRTPLAVISSAADNICDGLVSGDEQLGQYGMTIRNQSRQMTELVNQILLFASTRDRQKHYNLVPIQVGDLIQTVVDNTAALTQAAGFEIERKMEPGLPEVMGDRFALSKGLQNVLVNAIKYSGASRVIRITAALAASSDRNHKEIRISVEDGGIGIDRSEIGRIFDPFYRSPKVSAAQIHGTGLGLALAKNIVEAMGGRISVTSELGVGSIFTLHLPIAGQGKAHNSLLASAAHPFSQK